MLLQFKIYVLLSMEKVLQKTEDKEDLLEIVFYFCFIFIARK